MRSRERGNVSIVALAGVGLAIVLCLGVARVGAAATLKARADTAADAAALAAADSLALGQSPAGAVRAARVAAADNGARLLSCACEGISAEVVVEIGRARASARAEVDSRGRAAGLIREPLRAPSARGA
jgi:secretion/DNA translocation related TadE-like protein